MIPPYVAEASGRSRIASIYRSLSIYKDLHSLTSQEHRQLQIIYHIHSLVEAELNHGEAVRRNRPRPSPPIPLTGPHQPTAPVRQAARRPRRRPLHPGGDAVRAQLVEADPELGPRRRHLRRLRRGRPRGGRRDGRALLRAPGVGRVRDAGRAPPVGVGAGAARARGGVRRVRPLGAARGAAARRGGRRVPHAAVRRGRRLRARVGRPGAAPAGAAAPGGGAGPGPARAVHPARGRRHADVLGRPQLPPKLPGSAGEPVPRAGHRRPCARQLVLRLGAAGSGLLGIYVESQDGGADRAVGVPGQPAAGGRVLRHPPARPDGGGKHGVAGRAAGGVRRVRLLREHGVAGHGADERDRRGPLQQRQAVPVGGPGHGDRQGARGLRRQGQGRWQGAPGVVVPAAGGAGAPLRRLLLHALRLELDGGGAQRRRAHGGDAGLVGPDHKRQVRPGRVARRRAGAPGCARGGDEPGGGEVRAGRHGRGDGQGVQEESVGVEQQGEEGHGGRRQLGCRHLGVPVQFSTLNSCHSAN